LRISPSTAARDVGWGAGLVVDDTNDWAAVLVGIAHVLRRDDLLDRGLA
jgi:hypothetical protein